MQSKPYEFVESYTEEQAKKLYYYLSGRLAAIRQYHFTPELRDMFMSGKKKAQARIEELRFKA